MEFISVIAAAAAAWVFGAVWYSIFAKPWMQDSGVPLGDNGVPVNRTSPLPYILSLIAMLIVAGTMRYAFAVMELEGAVKGMSSGLGIGLFFISPWITINNGYAARPFRLTMIDSGYATFGCAVMGLVLALI